MIFTIFCVVLTEGGVVLILASCFRPFALLLGNYTGQELGYWPDILPLQSLLILDVTIVGMLDAVFIAHAEVLALWLDCCCHDVFQTLANISRVSSLVSLLSLFRC